MKVARLVIPNSTILDFGTVGFAKFLARFKILGTIRNFDSESLEVVAVHDTFDEVEDNGIRWFDRLDLPKVKIYLDEKGKAFGVLESGFTFYYEDMS